MATPVPKQFLQLLREVDRPGTFCASGRLSQVIPGLEVAGAGAIALPLDEPQAAALRKVARQAPFGKGTKTLVDTSVRRVWEFDAGRITLTNPEWASAVKEAIEAAQAALGLEKQKLEAHLYTLLLYEAGGFFLSHRDGEKIARMVATLVIVLPSAHEGGQLVVRHDGREESVDFSPHSRFQTQFAAFYADCEHEIRPVTCGFRLALVYNLTLEQPGDSIGAPTSREHVATAAKLLDCWRNKSSAMWEQSNGAAAPKLAVLLDHKYTQAGLCRDTLKGLDRPRADVLFAAARDAGCDASLALITYWESGAAAPSDDDYYGYGYRRNRKRSRHNHDSEDDDGGGSRREMEEVFDSGLTAEHFSDAEGKPLSYGEIPLEEEQLVSRKPLNKGKPDQEEFEGYTGNAGMTLERWYHRAAVVLWPAQSRFDVLCEAGTNAAVGGLQQMIRRLKVAAPAEQPGLKLECHDFADRIIAHWPERQYASRDCSELDDDIDDEDCGEKSRELDKAGIGRGAVRADVSEHAESKAALVLLSVLDDLDDTSLIAAWIRNVLAKDAQVHPGKALGDVLRRHTWRNFERELLELFDQTSNATLERNARLLADWSLRPDKAADRRKLCAQLAERAMKALELSEQKRSVNDWREMPIRCRELLPPLAQSFLMLDEPGLLERLVTHVFDKPKEFNRTTVQVPALLDLEDWLGRSVKQTSPALKRWLNHILDELKARKSNPPKEPADWRRDSVTGCKCADCKELSRFLDNPGAATLRIPLSEQRRRHIHGIIDSKRLDTTHATERKGRPFTLVCTKTKASYERALNAHRTDLSQLAAIQNLVNWHNGLDAR